MAAPNFQTPGYFDAQQINRQREMAKILQQQGMAQPQGQMVSGRFIAPSFGQYLAPALATYFGGKKQEAADTAEKELAARLQAQQAAQFKQYADLASGDAGWAAAQGPTPEGNNLSQTVTPVAPRAPDRAAALNFALQSTVPELRALALKRLEGMKLGEGEQFQELNLGTGKFETTAQGGAKYRAPEKYDLGDRYEIRYPDGRVETVPKGISPADAERINNERARLRDEGISVGGGGVASGATRTSTVAPAAVPTAPAAAPVASGPQASAAGASRPAPGQAPGATAPQASGGAAPGQAQQGSTPKAGLPQYKDDPSLSPKQNREARAKFNEMINTNRKNAEDSYGAIQEGITILTSGEPSSGRGENIVTGIGEFFGKGGKASQADAALNVIGGTLTSKVPRMEGSQSNADVILYQKQAGDVGNPNVPVEARLRALKTLIRLNKKYHVEGDWDALDKQIDQAIGNLPKTQAAGNRQINLTSPGAPQSFDQARQNAPAGGGLSPATRSKYGL